MKRIVEIDPDGRGDRYYEVYDDEHANPQNPSGWVADFNKVELETYRKECGEHTFVPYVDEKGDPA